MVNVESFLLLSLQFDGDECLELLGPARGGVDPLILGRISCLFGGAEDILRSR